MEVHVCLNIITQGHGGPGRAGPARTQRETHGPTCPRRPGPAINYRILFGICQSLGEAGTIPRMSQPLITLREITRQTYDVILRLQVAPEQRGMVATNAKSIAQAYFHPEAWFRGIYADDEPVGFIMLEQNTDKAEYFLWRLMIDQAHQRNGYGEAAVRQLIDYVRTLPGATELLVSHVKTPGNPGPFYEKLGFTYTDEEEDGERIMRLPL